MEKVQNPQLEADISALKVKSGLGGTSVLFTDAANLNAASVATLPESLFQEQDFFDEPNGCERWR